jgi:hypothetical protein
MLCTNATQVGGRLRAAVKSGNVEAAANDDSVEAGFLDSTTPLTR